MYETSPPQLNTLTKYIYIILSLYSDGVGRSGVFATVKSEAERLEDTGNINVFSTVKQLRESNPSILQIWVS